MVKIHQKWSKSISFLILLDHFRTFLSKEEIFLNMWIKIGQVQVDLVAKIQISTTNSDQKID